MQVRKASVIPFECVVRGYLEGSGWKEYQASQSICGIRLPAGLKQCDKLPSPIFTPTTKAESGHDLNVTFDEMANQIGVELASTLRDQSIAVYQRGADLAASRGIIIADTKFEWVRSVKNCFSSTRSSLQTARVFWPLDSYSPGGLSNPLTSNSYESIS